MHAAGAMMVAGMLCATVAGCRESAPPARSRASTAARSATAPPPVTVDETIAVMRRLHAERDYDKLSGYIAADARAAFIDTIMAMDEFLIANETLQTVIGETLDERLLPQWDLSGWAQAMGLFAPNVEIITTQDDGKSAAVRYQIADRVPLEDVKLNWVNDRWVYDPGDALPALAPAIREVSEALTAIARKHRRRPLSRDDLDTEFRLRVVPRLNRVLGAATTQPAGGESAPSEPGASPGSGSPGP